MRFSARVEVQLRPGIADPEGATIERALPALGFEGARKAAQLVQAAGPASEARSKGGKTPDL